MIEHVSPDCTCPGKHCFKCDKTLCYGKFSRDSSRWDKKQPCCKACNKARYHANFETISIKQKAYREANADEINTKQNAKRRENPEKVRAQKRISYHKNIQTRKAYDRRNLEKRRQYLRENVDKSKAYYQKRAKEHAEWFKQYRQKYPEHFTLYANNRRAREKNAWGNYTVEEWLALKAHYNHTCLSCGRREPDIKLTADHVIPLAKGGAHSIDNIQPLCIQCNTHKNVKTVDYRLNWQERKEAQ